MMNQKIISFEFLKRKKLTLKAVQQNFENTEVEKRKGGANFVFS
jgi:hypothetical protein